MPAETKRVLLHGSVYHVRNPYRTQKKYQERLNELTGEVEDIDDIDGDAMQEVAEAAINETVVARESHDGEEVIELTDENRFDEIDGQDFQHLFLYIVASPDSNAEAVDAVPLVESNQSPAPTQEDSG